MTYRLIRENEVEAQLLFKLDPAIARRFGRDALSSVEKAEGVLAEARISGEDVGTQIDDSQRRSANIGSEIARLEARSEEHTSELQSLMRISYAVFCLKKKTYK